jgi:hypothetical protein
LQRRSAGRRACRVRWRSDWAPLGMLLVLIGILMLLSVFMPSNEAVERAKEVAHNAVNTATGTYGRGPGRALALEGLLCGIQLKKKRNGVVSY